MTDHPITPPPEMVEQWIAQIWHEGTPVKVAASDLHVATQAARWGANQELEACIEWLDRECFLESYRSLPKELRAARRPKPPSLAEKALKRAAMLEELAISCGHGSDGILRRALEQLND